MKEFNVIISFSLIVIFVSVFFIHFALNNFFFFNELCTMKTSLICDEAGVFRLLLFTFLVVLAFIFVIETTIYYIFKGMEINVMAEAAGSKKDLKDMKDLVKRGKELKKSKSSLRRKYFRREIEEKTYKEMNANYDKEIMEIETEINKLKMKAIK